MLILFFSLNLDIQEISIHFEFKFKLFIFIKDAKLSTIFAFFAWEYFRTWGLSWTYNDPPLILSWPNLSKGCGSVILLRPKMGVESHKDDVICMPTQQCTNIRHISIERYHAVVSIMLRYLDQINTFGEICVAAQRKSTKDINFVGDLPYFALKCDNLP